MFDHTQYVPVLRWKRAEKQALRDLLQPISNRITPLVELTPWVFSNNKRKKPLTVSVQLEKIAADIFKYWGDSPIFIDLWHVPLNIAILGEEHILTRLAAEARIRNLKIVPVVGLGRGEVYENAVRGLLAVDGRGACLRVSKEDLDAGSAAEDINDLLRRITANAENVDLVLDYGFLVEPCTNLSSMISKVPLIDQWRSFTVIGGAFPPDLEEFKPGIGYQSRFEWIAWQDFVSRHSSTIRLPSFGDFTIQHPKFAEPPDFAHVSASIRYTSEERWVIMRGESIYKEGTSGTAQWPANAEILCLLPDFKGPTFSKGDEYIDATSKNPANPGRAETWLRAGFSHHLTLAVHQISNLFGVAR